MAIWIHYLLFTSVIGVGCLTLSGLTRLFANMMRLDYRPNYHLIDCYRYPIHAPATGVYRGSSSWPHLMGRILLGATSL